MNPITAALLSALMAAPVQTTVPQVRVDAPLLEHDHSGPHGELLMAIEHQLRCSCGCTLDAHTCQFQMQCSVSPVWSSRIQRELGRGLAEDVILAGFVTDYGNTVLLEPPEDMNTLGYGLPWAAVLLAAGAVLALLRRKTSERPASSEAAEPTDEEWARLQSEIKLLEQEADVW